MNAHSMLFSKIVSSDQGAREHYHVPKYQREYTWGKFDWERLLQDIDENDPGYFMGSVICVKDGEPESPGDEFIYEVVDGQQRLTTLSLLMMAIYQRLTDLQESQVFVDEEDRQDFQNSLASLRNKLVKKKKDGDYRNGEPGGWIELSKMCFLRVQPSSQNRNLDDYLYLISEVGLIKAREKPRYLGVRLICKAYRYFLDKSPAEVKDLLTLVSKINQLNFVHISVGSQADAFTLFETLNNRGVPLSAIDIIKNKMLAEMEKQHQINIDESYERWQDIIAAIPDATSQERFLRHFYHAFRWDPAIKVEGIPRAIKSKIIAIYEKLIKNNAQVLFDRLCGKAEVYGKLLTPDQSGYSESLQRQLTDLARINAAPAYQLLLYLFSLPETAFAENGFLLKAVELLQKFYVRRNVTDFPGTRDLDQGHIDLIQACQDRIQSGQTLTFEFLRDKLMIPGKFASLADFEQVLRGGVYSANILMTRYLLVKLDETHHTREYAPDLWARNEKERFVWTVEHVLPQAENISTDWVQMIANGNRAEATRLHEQHLDRLGNLTLSGYNSRLSAASFETKQTLAENRQFLGHRINIGYRNGLALNDLTFDLDGQFLSLATAPKWTAEMVEARTDHMVKMLLELYTIQGVD
jgi:uncharacterized protein with ParB-like and HNH nuclease domain